MEELLCDLLSALGVQMPENVGEAEFKRALYEATMSKVKMPALTPGSSRMMRSTSSGVASKMLMPVTPLPSAIGQTTRRSRAQ